MQAWRHRATTAEVGERLDREMFDRGSHPDDVLQDVAEMGPDVDGHVVWSEDTTNDRHGQDVVVPVGARLVPEVDQHVVRVQGRLGGGGGSDRLSPSLDQPFGMLFGGGRRLHQVERSEGPAEKTHGQGG